MEESPQQHKPRTHNLRFAKERRRELRRSLTPTEAFMWTKLKARRFHGYLWRRQFSVLGYFLDFYCPQAKLAIELDGLIHTESDQMEHDEERMRKLAELGIRILRFDNHRIFKDWAGVEKSILEELRKCSSNSSNN